MNKTDLTEDDLHVLRHMLGIDDPRKPPEPYRDYYCANAGDPKLARLEQLGMVARVQGPRAWLPYVVYATTDAGRAAAIESAERRLLPKRKRLYLRFLSVADCDPDLTFREFLTSDDYAEARRTA